jgi:hypothetical protein
MSPAAVRHALGDAGLQSDKNQLGGDGLSGNVKQKVDPFPTSLYPNFSSMQFDKLLGQG